MAAPSIEKFFVVVETRSGKQMRVPLSDTYSFERARAFAEQFDGEVFQKVGKRYRRRWSRDEIKAVRPTAAA